MRGRLSTVPDTFLVNLATNICVHGQARVLGEMSYIATSKAIVGKDKMFLELDLNLPHLY